MGLTEKTTSGLLADLASGAISSEDLTRACLDRIKSEDPKIGAFLRLDEEGALKAAREVDRKRAAGEELGSLAGIPVAIKDNINVKAMHTTCGSRFLENFVSPYDAGAISKLRTSDAVLIGKTNMDEFAMGSSNEHSAYQPTRNPVNPEHVPGGSSGGSAAAVAADMVPLSLGSDTGGSIRQPAAFCGVVGLKPTYGRVSRYGLVAFGSSLDQIGPFARDVDGAARLYHAIAGHDPHDATCSQRTLSAYDEKPVATASGLRVGVVPELLEKGLDADVAASVERTIQSLEAAGADIIHCTLPHSEYAIPTYYLVATAEASSNLARFDGVRYGHRAQEIRNLKDMYIKSRDQGFGEEVKRRILLGTYCLSSGYYQGYYLNAQKVRTRIINDFKQAFQKVDVLLTPTTPSTAFRLGEKTDDPLAMYLSDVFTVTANLAGIPAISLPNGRDRAGLPIGIQLMANHFEEDRLLQAARLVESLVTEA